LQGRTCAFDHSKADVMTAQHFTTSLHRFRLLIIIILLAADAAAQFPPAQGPPPISGADNLRELPVRAFTGYLDALFRDSIIPAINKSIDDEDPPTPINVTYTLKQGKPYMSTTRHTSQPNQRIITIVYSIDYKLDITAFPDRSISHSIALNFSCPDWHQPNGGIMYLTVVPEPPYLEGPSSTEQVLNVFLGNWLTPFIERKIRGSLPQMMSRRSPLNVPLNTCSCLGVVSGTAPDYEDGFIQYQLKPNRGRLITETAAVNINNITVSVDSIRRLRARNYESATILYEETEDINIECWVNQTLKTIPVNDMREGDIRLLPETTITIPKPGSDGTLVLITNIQQQSGAQLDTRYAVFTSRQNFGNGKRKMIIQKTFFTKPRRLPGGGMSKPAKVAVNAYELSLSVNANIQVVR
jgi:hypothetical protein